MFIVWGSRYYFARDKKYFQGRCTNCGKNVRLKSFTARKFDHLYFIPLIPQGKHRVLAECPKCNWVTFMPYDKWIEEYEKDTADIRRRLQESPDDPAVVAEGLGVATTYMDKDIYNLLVEGAMLAFNDNTDVMEMAWVAAERFGDAEKSEQALVACVKAGGTPLTCFEMAKNLAKMDKLEEMFKYAIKALEGKVGNREKEFSGFAEKLFKVGMVQQARDMMSKVIELNPYAGDIRGVRKIVKKLNAGSDNEHHLSMQVSFGQRLSDFARIAALWGAVASVLVGLLFSAVCYLSGMGRDVYLVNGTKFAATVSVDGDEGIDLQPFGHSVVAVAEGSHSVETKYQNGKTASNSVFISTPFISRPFDTPPLYILNPDEIAVIASISPRHRTEQLMPLRSWRELEGDYIAFRESDSSDPEDSQILTIRKPSESLEAFAAFLAQKQSQDFAWNYVRQVRPWENDEEKIERLLEKYRARLTFPFFLVNGLDRNYQVTFAGQAVNLPALGHQKVMVREQPLELKCPESIMGRPALTLKVAEDFWKNSENRNSAHIVNPDRQAIFASSEIVYGKDDYEPKFRIYGGDMLTTIRGIDHIFSDPPETQWQGTILNQLIHMNKRSYADYLFSIIETKPDIVKQELLRRLESITDDEYTMRLLSVVLSKDEYIAWLQSKRDVRPTLINVHRSYQNEMERIKPEYDLVSEYQQYLAKEPDCCSLTYLLARITPEKEKRFELYHKALGGPKPCMRASAALAYDLMSQGKYDETDKYIDKAIKSMPDNMFMIALQEELWEAKKMYGKLLKANEKERKANPLSFNLALRRVQLLSASGKDAEAHRFIKKYISEAKAQVKELDPNLENYLLTELMRNSGELEKAANVLSKLQDDQSRVLTAIFNGKFGEANKIIAGFESPAITYPLSVYIAAHGKDDKAAEDALKKSIEILASSEADSRLAAEWLEGKKIPTVQEVQNLPYSVSEKRMITAALGLKEPSIRKECFELTDTLNFSTTFPHWIIKNRIAEM